MERKLGLEVAKKEVEKWLDFKRVSHSKRLSSKTAIDDLAEAISWGDLSLNKEHEFIQVLKLPIGDLKELKYKPRLKMSEIRVKTQNTRSDDGFGLIAAYVAALTNQNGAIIDELDTEDNRLAQSIATFFL